MTEGQTLGVALAVAILLIAVGFGIHEERASIRRWWAGITLRPTVPRLRFPSLAEGIRTPALVALLLILVAGLIWATGWPGRYQIAMGIGAVPSGTGGVAIRLDTWTGELQAFELHATTGSMGTGMIEWRRVGDPTR